MKFKNLLRSIVSVCLVPASSINIYKRDVQGVIIMRIEEGNALVSIERVPQEEESEN